MNTHNAPALNLALDHLEDAHGFPPPAEEIAAAFTDWVASTGKTMYPHQSDALLGIVAGDHVIVATPTGSGKSLIAMQALFTALATGVTAYYTAPLKALVSEKFFELIRYFGAHNVGMVTGDSAINANAPIICATSEILANIALREGENADCGMVVMDEFHFYADPQRGWAWQVPLLELPQAQQVLLSATLGDTSWLEKDLHKRTGRNVSVIDDAIRPVPLHYSWSTNPLGEVIQELVTTHLAPVYVVHFAQREAISTAQQLLSMSLVAKEQKLQIAAVLENYKFGAGFGKVLSKLLRKGIGVHHAGLLPRYRRLVERLTQAGLLNVICGTDTLGVGINVPIRTVLITSLTKFDGNKMRHLNAREFHQIAGRAGRAGFDTIGYVIVQAPDHEIENARRIRNAGDDAQKLKRVQKVKPEEGKLTWSEKTFETLQQKEPETLKSQFRINHATILNLLQRPDPVRAAVSLLTQNHEPSTERNLLIRQAIEIYTSLRRAEVIQHENRDWRTAHKCDAYGMPASLHPAQNSSNSAAGCSNHSNFDPQNGNHAIHFRKDVPSDFALNAPLSPFALSALDLLDPLSLPTPWTYFP
ncbi:DEAD/DEAH box helicase [Arcanobacterium hippocoleae]|uniref:DEAD/DEAH box helicase n=1 Tax=Arcanobacterium hippocoleae TaxID=149017 RepID=UPI0033414D22